MPLNAYTDFVKQINLVDGNKIRFAESDTQFITMNKRTKPSPLNPGIALVRFQVLEILVRLGIKRYEESRPFFVMCAAGESKTKAGAVQRMLEENLYPYYGNFLS